MSSCGSIHSNRSGILPPRRLRSALLSQVRFLRHSENVSKRVVACAAVADDERQEQLLASITFIGLTGTLALAAGAVSGVNIVQTLQWDDASGISFGLQLFLPLILLDAALFVPSYSIPGTVLATECSRRVGDSTDASHASAARDLQQQKIIDLAAVVEECSSSRRPGSWQLLLALYPVMLSKIQDDLQRFPFPTLLLLAVGRSAAKAMLEQGFMLTFLARWLTDRMYEAGLDDVITGSAMWYDQQLQLPQLGLWLAALLTTAIWGPSAFYLAETTQQDVSAMMLLSSEAGSILTPPTPVSSSSSSSSSAKGSMMSTATAAPMARIKGQPAHRQQQDTYQEEKKEEEQADEEEEEEEADGAMAQLVLEYKLVKATKMCFESSPARLAYSLGLFKELARIVIANVCYVATGGNLAAVVVSSAAVNGMLLLYAAQKQQQVAPGLLQIVESTMAGQQHRKEL